jgi:hypothetical protein
MLGARTISLATLLKIVGLVLAIGGLSAAGLGWPYRMIDWGNIQVVLGGLAFIGGLILAALGLVLGAVRGLHESIASSIANNTLADVEGTRAAPMEASLLPTRVPEPVPDPSVRPGAGTAVAAGAAAAATAGAIIFGKSGSGTEGDSRSGTHADADAATAPEFSDTMNVRTEPPADGDDSGLPQADVVAPPFSEGERQTTPHLADDGLVWIKPEETPAGLSLDALTSRINEAAGDLTALRRGVIAAHPEPQAAPTDPADADRSMPVEDARTHVDKSDAGERAEDAPDDDTQEPAEPTAVLQDATLASDVAEASAPGMPEDAENSDSSTDMSDDRDAPSEREPDLSVALDAVENAITAPMDPDDLLDVDADPTESGLVVEADSSGDQAVEEAEAVEAPASQDALASDAAPGPEQGSDLDQPPAPTGPAANAEGVVSVHRIGDSTYTMFSDGTIRAETPNGAFGFATVAELKAYLAGDKSVARPLV